MANNILPNDSFKFFKLSMLQQSPSPFFTVLYQYLGNLNCFLAPPQGYTNSYDPPTHRSKKGKRKKQGPRTGQQIFRFLISSVYCLNIWAWITRFVGLISVTNPILEISKWFILFVEWLCYRWLLYFFLVLISKWFI